MRRTVLGDLALVAQHLRNAYFNQSVARSEAQLKEAVADTRRWEASLEQIQKEAKKQLAEQKLQKDFWN